MNILLIFFALPIATIILAIVLEKILKCPVLTAATFFAIYLIITFTVFDASFLVFAIVYTILAYIAAVIAEIFFRRCCDAEKKCCCWNMNNTNTVRLTNRDIERIANEIVSIQNSTNNNSNCNNNISYSCQNDVATVSELNNTTRGRTNWCCYRR